jgi:hypothetical protein
MMIQRSLMLLVLLPMTSAAHGQATSSNAQAEAVQELRPGSFNKGWIVRPLVSAFGALTAGSTAPEIVTLPHDAMLGL